MAERQDPDREVLTSLPRSRPTRRSAKRGERAGAKTPAAKAAADVSAVTRTAATKAKPKPKPKPKSEPSSAARPRTAPRRTVPPAGYAAPASRADEGAATGPADLLSTTIQAAAELAQIGLTVGRQTLRSMLDRLPKP